MTSLFDRIRQRRDQAAPPDGSQDPPAVGPAPEAPTEVHATADVPADAAGGTTTPHAPGDLTVVQPAVDLAAGDAATPSEDPAPADASTGSAAPSSASDAPGQRSLADEAALAAELPDDVPSRSKPSRATSGLTPLIPSGDPTPTEPTAVASPDATPSPAGAAPAGPAVPQPPVLGPPTSGGTPAAAPPSPPTPAPATAPEPAEVPKVTIRNRGRMRRRLRYLRRVRELGYRDLGGLVFELRRANASNQVLVDAKVDALRRIDAELHALEHGLRDYRNVEELHEPGVSVCIRCGALHGSDANYCPQCGVSVTTPVATVSAAAPPPATVDGGTPVEPVAPAASGEPGTGSTPDARPRAAATPSGAPSPAGDQPTPADGERPRDAAAGGAPDAAVGEPTVVLEDASAASGRASDTTTDER